MKTTKTLFSSAVLAAALFAVAAPASATLRYWDTSGANAGLGVGGPYDWLTDNLWNTDPTGGGAGVLAGWVNGDDAYFNGNGVSTVTVRSAVTVTNFHIGDGIAAGTAVTLNIGGPSTISCVNNIEIGASASGTASATLNLAGSGTVQAINFSAPYQSTYVGLGNCSGTVNITGSNALLYNVILDIGNGSPGMVNVSGGELGSWGNAVIGNSAPGTLNVSSNGTVIFNNTSMAGVSGATATINLNGGRSQFGSLTKTTSDPNTKAILNFNGGIMAAFRTSNPFITNLDAMNVLAGGAIIDTTNFNSYIEQSFLDGGGGGGLTKLGTGTLYLYGANLFTGPTSVNSGILYLEYNAATGGNSGFSNSSSINIAAGANINVSGRNDDTLPILANQILTGGGSITGKLAVSGTVAPGAGLTGATGTLTASATLALSGTTWLKLNRANTPNSDKIVGSQNIIYGGALVVTNVGTPLMAGDTFYLFAASSGYTGAFSSITLPPLTGSNVWNTNNLAVNGSISVGNPSTPPPGMSSWTARYVGTTINGQVAPSGYYEYLPSSYNSSQALTNYPLLIAMHGSGQYGDGTATGNPGLANILTDGLTKLIQANTYPVAQSGGVFDASNVIVLNPQCTVPWPMDDPTWRAFFNFALAAYPKVDRRRIWFTGLSYGSTTVTTAMDYTQDPSPDDAAGVLAIAWRGDDFNTPVVVPPIGAIGKVVPFWLLTAQDDTSSNPDVAVNELAAGITGNNNLPSDASVFPSGIFSQPYTAYFNGAKWILSPTQIDPISEVNPKMTYFTQIGHDSWDPTYQNPNSWAWLLQQMKPAVNITAPASNIISPQGSALTFTGAATDKNGASLTGGSLIWTDSINGELGTGTSLTVSNLSIGAHIVKLQATDYGYRDNKTTVNVTVPYVGAFTALFDLGPTGMATTGWNDVTSVSVSTVTNAVNTNGVPIGLNLAITSPFVGAQNGGMVASNLYPVTAEEDTLYVGGAGEPQTGQLLLSGLNPAETYSFTFFASRDVTDDRTSTYTINGNTVSLQAALNVSNTVSLNNMVPNAQGQITITVGHGASATYGYLGVMTVTTTGAPVSGLQAFHLIDNGQDTATPGNDGVANIVKYALNMTTNNYADLATYNRQMMTSNGVSGLPLISLNASNQLTMTFVERLPSSNPGINYFPEVSGTAIGPWTLLTSATSATTLNSTWERVVYTDTLGGQRTNRFIRLLLEY